MIGNIVFILAVLLSDGTSASEPVSQNLSECVKIGAELLQKEQVVEVACIKSEVVWNMKEVKL